MIVLALKLTELFYNMRGLAYISSKSRITFYWTSLMSDSAPHCADSGQSDIDWPSELSNLAFAHGLPEIYGSIKSSPEDFIVREIMDVIPSGEGEHTWLDITKTRNNTDKVARQLAKFSGVSYRDVGYSGIKDFQAVTRQWFSVWRPKGHELDWSSFEMTGVTLNKVVKHNRKIKRSTHKRNFFQICVRNLSLDPCCQVELNKLAIERLDSRLHTIAEQGVPNYFGAQRFGRNASNMPQVLDMFAGSRRVKDRHLRSLLLSSARSWIFNRVLSARINDNTWNTLFAAEPANLNGSNSVFIASNSPEEQRRIKLLDIHPTSPMWGDGRHEFELSCPELAAFENQQVSDLRDLKLGLESARIAHQRRATRTIPENLKWVLDNDSLILCFELSPGQYATSVLRETVKESV